MENRRNLWIVLVGAVCIVLFGGIKFLMFVFSHEMKVEGYILDEKTKEPISNVLVDFQGSNLYLINEGAKGNLLTKLYTDEKGFFSAIVEEDSNPYPALQFKKRNYRVGGVSIDNGFKTIHFEVLLRRGE